MLLHKRLEDDMRIAMKGGDSAKLSVLRMLLSAVKVFEIEKKIALAEDGDILQIIQKQIRQHAESIEQFEKGKRQDLADKERKESGILEAYMPSQLSEEDLSAVIKEAIAQTGAAAKADMGKVMKVVMDKVKGRADGKRVNQLIMGMLK